MALIGVMEDDAGARMLVGSVLRKDGHEVVARSRTVSRDCNRCGSTRPT